MKLSKGKFKSTLNDFKPLIVIALIIISVFLLGLFLKMNQLKHYEREVESMLPNTDWGKRTEETIQYEDEELKQLKKIYGVE